MMTSSEMAFWAADSSSTGNRHQMSGRLSATTFSSTPVWNAIRYRPRPVPPMTAASTVPRARSRPGSRASTPIEDGRSPARASR